MLKRSQSALERDPSARSSKKPKHTADSRVDTPDANLMEFFDFDRFDIHDASQFQTPFPAADTEHFELKSSVGQFVPPENFSPLPVARRILSRTSSRNLKENVSCSSRNLASPFSSRPGSVASSPKNHTRNKHRPPHLRSRTLSNNNQQDNIPRAAPLSVAQSARNSPNVDMTSFRDRRPSVPNPAYMLNNVSRQDWLVPPKALSRSMTGYDSVFGSPSETAFSISEFFNQPPQAASTPHKRMTFDSKSQTCMQVPEDIQNADKTMIIGDDNFSMSGDTLVHVRTPERRISKHTRSIIRSPLTADDPCGDIPKGPSSFKLVSLRNYDLSFPRLMRSPGSHDSDDDDDSLLSPARPVSRPIPLPSLDSSPSLFPGLCLAEPVSAYPTWFSTNDLHGSGPIRTTPPSSPQQSSHPVVHVPSSPESGNLRDMLSILDLDGSNRVVGTDEEPPHDSGISQPNCLPRSRSLDSPADVKSKQDTNVRTRDRRGTIRASDFMRTKSTGDNTKFGSGLSLTRRTRSGTVIGPAKPSNTNPPPALAHVASHSGRKANYGNRLGQNDANLLPPLSDGESEDELLLKTYRDPFLATGKAVSGRPSRPAFLEEGESEDDLLLKA